MIGSVEFFSLVYYVDINGNSELFQSHLQCKNACAIFFQFSYKCSYKRKKRGNFNVLQKNMEVEKIFQFFYKCSYKRKKREILMCC